MDTEEILDVMEDKVLYIGEAFGYAVADGQKLDLANLSIHLNDVYRSIKELKNHINEIG